MYRGTATAYIGKETIPLEQNDVLWIPAGVRNKIDIAADSILLPLFDRRALASERHYNTIKTISFPPEYENYLLHTVIAQRTGLRPENFSTQPLLDAIFSHASSHNAPSNNEGNSVNSAASSVEKLIKALHSDPADNRSIEQWAQRLGLTPDQLTKAFKNTTGDALATWRVKLKMSHARNLLGRGETCSAVSRKLGYAHPPAFTKSFKATFGLSPRQYQQTLRD